MVHFNSFVYDESLLWLNCQTVTSIHSIPRGTQLLLAANMSHVAVRALSSMFICKKKP